MRVLSPRGEILFQGKPLGDDDLSRHQNNLGFRLAAACLSLCHNSQIKKVDGLWEALGDPTDSACAVAGWKINGDVQKFAQRHSRLHEYFFDTKRKRMSVIHEYEGEKWVFSKGGAGGYIDLVEWKVSGDEIVPIDENDFKRAEEANRDMAGKAMRVLALCARPIDDEEDMYDMEKIESGLIFLGIIGIMDPPRPEVKDAIEICQQAGIKVKMITGDQQFTASAIGKELGITDGGIPAVNGGAIAKFSDAEMDEAAANSTIFSRVTPDQKMRIVSSLQNQGEIVAMTGDGVNDAPALSRANIGIAMGISGTDVAKDASDMVLQDDNFANIVNAVEEGRKIYQNIRNFVRYQVSTNVAAVSLIVISTLIFGWNLPLTATQILVINILMDGPPAVALGVEKKHGNVMNRPPRPVDEGLPNRNDIWLIFYLGAVMVAGTLLVFFLAGGGLETCESLPLSDGTNLPFNQADCEAGVEAEIAKWESYAADKFIHAQTMTLSVFIMFQLFNVMNCRSQEESIFSLGVFSNKAINIAFLVSFALLLFFVQLADFTIPFTSFEIGGLLSTKVLSLNDWGVIIAVAALVVVIEEFRKLIVNSRIFAIDSRR